MNGRTNHRYRPSLNDARCVVMLSGPHSDRRERSREQPEAATVLPERGRCRCCSLVRARIAAGRVDRHRSPRHDKTQNTQEANLPAPVACAARHGTTKGDQKPPEQDGTEAIARFLLSSARGRQGYLFAGRIEQPCLECCTQLPIGKDFVAPRRHGENPESVVYSIPPTGWVVVSGFAEDFHHRSRG